MDDQQPKRRRVIVDDDDDDDLGSNPDEFLEEQPSEEEEGEDLDENWLEDYQPAPELDEYDAEGIDFDFVEEDKYKQIRDRLAADEELDALYAKRREQEEAADDRLDQYGRDDESEEEEEPEDELGDENERGLNLEAFDSSLREWIAEERTRREIHRRLKNFLKLYYVGIEEISRHVRRNEHLDVPLPLPSHLKVGHAIYPSKIKTMCAENKSSLEVSYGHLAETQPLLAIWLTDVPRDMLTIFDEVLTALVHAEFPHYKKISRDLHVRIINLPMSDRLRDLRQGDLNNLIKVNGVVTRRTGVFPQLKSVCYDCSGCNALLGPFQVMGIEHQPSACASCGAKGPFRTNAQKTEYGNFQRLTLQETPGSVPPGRVPRYKEVTLLGDLIDIARPGEEIEVTGIYEHNMQGIARNTNGFPVFGTVIAANGVQKRSGTTSTLLSDEDRRRILDLSKDPLIGERIIRSIAPSIYGHRHVKTAVALALFGGCRKDTDTHRIRGDINILLLGDPGTAKSQILKYAEKTAPRSVYTTGKGASAVGLTAGVHKDHLTKEWTLEGGALVLADQGVCLIDEFDKMNEQDRTSIHEAMEQQTISVSKAGIVTSLQARCSVIAAANPIGGRYDASFNFAENVELTDPILQRFDILCVLQDVVDPVVDEKLALFVVNSHIKSHPDHQPSDDETDEDEDNSDEGDAVGHSKSGFADEGPEPVDQATLKKYIMYAKSAVRPVLHSIDNDKIQNLYAELRKQSAISGGVPIAVRHIESIVRMSEASARMHLRDHVREDDVDLAIKVVLESFLQSQKVSVRKTLQRSFRKYITYGEESNQLLMHQLQALIVAAEQYKMMTSKNPRQDTEVHIIELENRAKELNIFDLRPFYNSLVFKNHGLSVDERNGLIIKHFM